jgi:hypothetical protein
MTYELRRPSFNGLHVLYTLFGWAYDIIFGPSCLKLSNERGAPRFEIVSVLCLLLVVPLLQVVQIMFVVYVVKSTYNHGQRRRGTHVEEHPDRIEHTPPKDSSC